jgi:hypothetical protein
MDKLVEIKEILGIMGMPKAQQSDLCALTILAMSDVTTQTPFTNASNAWLRIHDIIQFINTHYDNAYAENSRETFRKKALHHFRTAAIVEDNGKATNSPNYRWRITDEFLSVIKEIGISDAAIVRFIENHQKLVELYASKKKMQQMPVLINGNQFQFSAGKHNRLQKAIIEDFAPRFAHNSRCLYVGDTTEKDLFKDKEKLQELGFEITLHDKMPDIVLYREDANWIYFIEAVTSVGPMSPKRITEIEAMTQNVTAGKIYVTAFLDFATYKKFSDAIAWETEVWIAEMPEHMIHLNGDRFLGPR